MTIKMTSDEAMSSAFVDTAARGWSTLQHEDFEAGWQAALDWSKSGQEPVAWVRPDKGHIDFRKYAGYNPLFENPTPAQPVRLSEEKPVAFYYKSGLVRAGHGIDIKDGTAFYTKPANPIRLTAEEIKAVWEPLQDALCLDHKVFANAIQDAMLAKGAAQPAVVQQLIEAAEEAENCLYSFYAGPEWASEDFVTLQKLQAALKAVKGE